MSHYELLVIHPGKLSETEVPATEQAVRELCKTAGVSITREESRGKQKLAYDIKGEQYGYYQMIECDGEPTMIANLHKQLSLSPEVVRHAIYEKPVKSQETLQRETKLRERIAHARATKAAASALPSAGTSAASAAPTVAVDVAALDKKLDELLATPEGV